MLGEEYRLTLNFLGDDEFHEGIKTFVFLFAKKSSLVNLQVTLSLGIRAMLLAKDEAPKWNPSRIEDVHEQRVLHFFRPLPKNDNLPM